MNALRPCPSCGRHVRATDAPCPFCAAPPRAAGVLAAVVLSAAALACNEPRNVTPVYGAPAVLPVPDAGDTAPAPPPSASAAPTPSASATATATATSTSTTAPSASASGRPIDTAAPLPPPSPTDTRGGMRPMYGAPPRPGPTER